MPAESYVRRVVPAVNRRDERRSGRDAVSSNDPRSAATHDRDRTYYSSSFRRLAGVTQVFTPSTAGFLTHNRLTHSLKVAQVSRSLATVLLANETNHELIDQLGGLDPEVAEAAGLAHDLGHPPFGHIGEQVLDEYARDVLGLDEGFEGNAQTFRIVSLLEVRNRRPVEGLDFTRATSAAVLKYPWKRELKPTSGDVRMNLKFNKYGAYATEDEAFSFSREWLPIDTEAQSLEAAIMDIADDITYALHDLEDFQTSQILNISSAIDDLSSWRGAFAKAAPQPESTYTENAFERLRFRLSTEYPKRFDREQFLESLDHVESHLTTLRQHNTGARRQQANLRTAVSVLITSYLTSVRLVDEPAWDQPPAQLGSDAWHQIQILKEITKHYVITRPDFAAIQRGQQVLLKDLLCKLQLWAADTKDRNRLPHSLLEWIEVVDDRAIIDYVSSLSDHQATALHQTLSGHGAQSLLATFAP